MAKCLVVLCFLRVMFWVPRGFKWSICPYSTGLFYWLWHSVGEISLNDMHKTACLLPNHSVHTSLDSLLIPQLGKIVGSTCGKKESRERERQRERTGEKKIETVRHPDRDRDRQKGTGRERGKEKEAARKESATEIEADGEIDGFGEIIFKYKYFLFTLNVCINFTRHFNRRNWCSPYPESIQRLNKRFWWH